MVPVGADHNLLFGILALQMDFISRDDLLAAMGAWLLQKHRPLADVLQERGALAATDRALLEPLVGRHIQQHGDDPARSLAALSSADRLRDDLAAVAKSDPDVRASLAALDRGTPTVAATAPPEAWPSTMPPWSLSPATLIGTPTSEGQRFRILRPHARGGLGEVFVAHDAELHREVALKQIQEHHADHPESRARFLEEAEITGGLEHPGIVPVYGLGHYADGRPFYAMRFIRGDSLEEAIGRFHHADEQSDRDPGERTLALRQLLGRFIDVCNAVAYAHSRGVLHRDLKPGNVMLGPYGETLVVDWGLAKTVGRREEVAFSTEGTLRPESGSGRTPTRMGSAIGTPAYMSPEQADGRLDDLGPASDVYSLGAMLYNLLTGRVPIEGGDLGAVMKKVKAGEFPRPRQVNHTVHPALEAVCLKAMAKEPDGRYPSPRDLAEDIEHWLADERVSAYAEPWTTRLGRWVRQHKILVSTAAAAAAVLTTVVIAGVLLAASADRERLERSRADEQEHTARAMDNLRSQAERARDAAEEARREAEVARRELAQLDYIRQMDLAHREWQEGNVERALSLLQETNPAMRRWEWGYVNRMCHDYLLELKASILTDTKTVALTADGKRLAAPGDDHSVNVWDPQTGELIGSFRVHTGKILSIALSPDGQRIVSSAEGDQFAVKVWNAHSGQMELTLRGHTNNVGTACFSPDGQRIATGSYDHTAKVWDAKTGAELLTLRGPGQTVRCLAFSPDGKRIATARGEWMNWDSPQEVHLWDAQTGEQLRILKGHSRFVSHVAFSPDGQRLASASLDGTIRLWDAETGQARRSLQGHNASVWCADFSADGKRIVSAGEDQTVKVWDAQSGRVLRTLLGHTKYVRWAGFGLDGKRVYSASNDETIKVWDAESSTAVTVLRGHNDSVFGVAISPDGKTLASAGADRLVKIWDPAINREILTLTGHALAVSSVGFSPDGKRLVSGSWDRTVKIWNTRDGQLIRTLSGHTEHVQCVVFSPDGRRVASASRDNTVRVSDVETGELILTLRGHSAHVYGVSYSPDGKQIVSAARDNTARVWDAGTGAEVLSLIGHQSSVWKVAFSRDGRRLVTGGSDATLRVWDVLTGRELRCLRGHKGLVFDVTFSPDGDRVASAGDVDGTVKVWDVQTGQPIITLRDHASNPVNWVVFSPDGHRLASGSNDRTVRVRNTLWDH